MSNKKTVGWRVLDANGDCAFHAEGDFGLVAMTVERNKFTFDSHADAVRCLRLMRSGGYENEPYRLVRVVSKSRN